MPLQQFLSCGMMLSQLLLAQAQVQPNVCLLGARNMTAFFRARQEVIEQLFKVRVNCSLPSCLQYPTAYGAG